MPILYAKISGNWVALGSFGRDGPTGPPGPQGIQGIQGPIAPMVVKQTQPTAADYGQATIPLNAVWIQAP